MHDAATLIQARTPIRPDIGLVLGSGLGAFAESLANSVHIPYKELAGFPISTAIGHAGKLVIGTLGANGRGATDIAVMSGRFHLYEGYTARQVVSGVLLLHELGIKRLVLTNAAGSINPNFGRGDLVLISDHINLQGVNPLVGPNDDTQGPRFPDMTQAYSIALRGIAQQVAAELGITLHHGVYAGLLGPSYETPAEIRYLRTIGAELVGMSTVAEVIAANHLGIEVLGISCVTNVAAGLGPSKLHHDEVLEVGKSASTTLLRLLGTLLPRLAAT